MSDFTNTPRAFFPSLSLRVSGLIAAFAFLICLCAAQNAQAQTTFTVTRTDDRNTICVSGVDCSLREAVIAANTAATDDTINFAIPGGDTGCTSGGICTITLTGGNLAINDAATAGTLTITNTTGANNLLISGNNTSRVFYLNNGAILTINGVTITKGNGTGTNFTSGGGIYSQGTLTLTNSTVSGNTARRGGGGIENGGNNGTLKLTNSTVSGNTSGDGGGIRNLSGRVTLINSTVSGNTSSGTGGGIVNSDGTLNLTGSTVNGNTSNGNTFSGGGIYSRGTTTLINSTVSGNSASSSDDTAGGIYCDVGILNLTNVTVTQNKSTSPACTNCAGGILNFNVQATLNNTIVAGNTVANTASSPDFRGAIVADSAYNLIGNGFGTTGIANGDANSNQVGSSGSPINPLLDPTLQLNGGTTANHALLAGSPAIDKGNSFGTTSDQRGLARPFDNPNINNAAGGDGADIGAFEVQSAPTAASISIGGRVMTANGRGIVNVSLTLTDSTGQIRTTRTTAFGYYHFADVRAGETYILSAFGKRFSFSQPTQVLNITGESDEINFIADSEISTKVF